MLLFSIHIEQINDHSNFLFVNDDVMGFNMSVGRVSRRCQYGPTAIDKFLKLVTETTLLKL